jgi:putative transposase
VEIRQAYKFKLRENESQARGMGRKVKGSSNWKKARRRVQKVHAHIGTARKDFLHKQSTKLGNA